MPTSFGVVDLFAGPGGLGEGFASLEDEGHNPFRIGISIEKEASAHRTLSLRAFLREHRSRTGTLPGEFLAFHAGKTSEPDWADIDAHAWSLATEEARDLELGTREAAEAIDGAIVRLRNEFDDTVLIGGPPCQAYSLVGRARAKGKPNYVPEEDDRNYLFREYIGVLDKLRPAAFVMENVKGMLSSTVESRKVFEMLMEDLASLGSGAEYLYEIRAIHLEDGVASLREASQPKDFIVHAEQFGVPQRRHRVIIIGIRADLAAGIDNASVVAPGEYRTVLDAIGDLPKLRSAISRGGDSDSAWCEEVVDHAKLLAALHPDEPDRDSYEFVAKTLSKSRPLPRSSTRLPENYATSDDDLLRWLERPELRAIAQHEARSHMASDLGRYLFASVFGNIHGRSPKAKDFPALLEPNHGNWHSGKFNDRFRVQLGNEPSTTVTSHISKDGHYFIHPDAKQCRSLTVREAARLQSFPDDYLFLGNRTQQYVQVGNAVPPYLARYIALLIYRTLTA